MPAVDAFVLGIDAGGTKTEAWLARVQAGVEQVVGQGRAGAGNPRSVGVAAAVDQLSAAAAAAWTDAGLSPGSAARAVLAVAGTSDPTVGGELLADCRRRGLADNITLVHDADPLLAVGAPHGWGVALVAGTGSSAVAVSADGRRVVVGGWGAPFGDEGSGYWLGRAALQAVSRAADGRGPATRLIDDLLHEFSLDDPRRLLHALQQRGEQRGQFAQLAPLVVAAADAGDSIAQALLGAAAKELAALVAAACRQAGFAGEYSLAAAGGLLCCSESLRQRLGEELAAVACSPASIALVPHPAAGCVKLAAAP